MAAMTAAERQRRYRAKSLQDPDGALLTRLQVMIGPHAVANLDRLTSKTGTSKRDLVERAINELAKTLHCNGHDLGQIED